VATPDLAHDALRPCPSAGVAAALLAADERQVIRCYKFGVLYARAGQGTEFDMYANRHGGSDGGRSHRDHDEDVG
jgi:hypothetical protein